MSQEPGSEVLAKPERSEDGEDVRARSQQPEGGGVSASSERQPSPNEQHPVLERPVASDGGAGDLVVEQRQAALDGLALRRVGASVDAASGLCVGGPWDDQELLTDELARDIARLDHVSRQLAHARRWIEHEADDPGVPASRKRVESVGREIRETPSVAGPNSGDQARHAAGDLHDRRDEPASGGQKRDGQPDDPRPTKPVEASAATPREHASLPRQRGSSHMEREPSRSTVGQSLDNQRRRPPSGRVENAAPSDEVDHEIARLGQASVGPAPGDNADSANVAELQSRLREARTTIRSLRERTIGVQTDEAGRSEASLDAASRKLDQRARALRERVVKAQEAINEKARKLQSKLAEERGKLRAYHARLQERAQQLANASRESQQRLDEERAALQEALKAKRLNLAQREAELESRFAGLTESERRQIADRRAELERTVQARLVEIEREAEARQAKQEASERALAEREEKLRAQIGELREAQNVHEQALRVEANRLAEVAQKEREKLAREGETLRRQADEEISRREANLEELHALAVQQQAALEQREAELDAAQREHEAAAQLLAAKTAEIERRDQELIRLSTAMEVRERRLQEWQTRVDAAESHLEQTQKELEGKQASLDRRLEENRQQAAEIATQYRDMREQREAVEEARRQVDALRADLLEKEEAAAATISASEEAKQQYEGQLEQIAEERHKYADLASQAQDIERREAELAGRISEVFEREQAAARQSDEIERRNSELAENAARLQAGQQALDERRRQFDLQAAEIESRAKQVEETQRLLQERKEGQDRLHGELDCRHKTQMQEAEALDAEKDKLSQQQAMLDEARGVLDLERRNLAEREAALEQRRNDLRQSEEDLAKRRAALAESQSKLDEQSAEVAREREAAEQEKARLAGEDAKLDRRQMAHRDAERALGEEKEAVQAACGRLDSARRDLDKLVKENEQLREELLEKASRMKLRKEQLAKDATAVDERNRSLAVEEEQVRRLRDESQRQREQLEADRKQLDADRKEMLRQREELEQSRKTFQAGLRSLDESQQGLIDRESKLADRAKELERFRDRLEEEYAELRRQRRSLLALQEEHAEGTNKVEALMAQTEERRTELQRREDALATDQQALSARAAELARAEETANRRIREQEAASAKLAADVEALEARRKELEADLHQGRAQLDEERKQQETRLDARQAEIDRRAQEVAAAARKIEIDPTDEDLLASPTLLAAARERVEAELAERIAEAACREEESERRCRMRSEELDRDIEQRLARLEHEIKERREEAERTIDQRRRVDEEELRKARNRLDEQVEDLRRRQAAIWQEQRLLQEQRHASKTEAEQAATDRGATEDVRVLDSEARADGELPSEAAGHATRLRPADETAELRAVEAVRNGKAEEAVRGGSIDETVRRGDAVAAVPVTSRPFDQEYRPEETGLTDLGMTRLGGPLLQDESCLEARRLDEPSPGEGSLDRTRRDQLDLDDKDLAVVQHGEARSSDGDQDASGLAEPWPASSRRRPIGSETRAPGAAPRRFRPLATGTAAAALGAVVALAYMWVPTGEVTVRSRLVFQNGDGAASLSPAEHLAGLCRPATLQRASDLAGVNLSAQFYEQRRIRLASDADEDALEMAAWTEPGTEQTAQGWLQAWAKAYQESLEARVLSKPERDRRLQELEATRDQLREQRQAAQKELDRLQSASPDDPELAAVEAARKAKPDLKQQLLTARQELDAAEKALAEFDGRPLPTDPVTPTEEQLVRACAADAELMQAVEQRDGKAWQFYQSLVEAMSRAQTPLTALLSSIDALEQAVREQLQDQANKEIRREIEEILVGVRDYGDQARAFSQSWDALAPRVAAWKAGGDPQTLLEYQRKAESLIRDFHAASGKSFGNVAQKIDAIGRAGAEMTQRRITQGKLLKAANAGLEARNEWIVSAQGVLPRYNKELKALRDAIRDLAPRIDQRRQYHRERLIEHLTKVREDDWNAERVRLEKHKEDLAARRQQLSDEFVRLDEAGTIPNDVARRLQERQDLISRQQDNARKLDERLAGLDQELTRLRGTEQVSLAGSVTYEPLPSIQPQRFDPRRRAGAIGLGAGAALLFMFAAWFVSQPRFARRGR